MRKKPKGFSLVEMMVALGIIAVLTTLVTVAVLPALKKGRDAKRKATIAQVRRLLASSSCYMPDAGTGDYDLGELYPEIRTKYPQYAPFLVNPPKDPKGGTDNVTKYRYQVAAAGGDCIVYANLENENEPVTLIGISAPTAGAGSGVLEAADEGPNGSKIYFQAANK